MQQDVELFRSLIVDATARMTSEYFLLPVASADPSDALVQYRERVYAYELYHQLRLRWPANWAYSLGGEIDKRCHPLIRDEPLHNAKPDLLVYIPGRMDRNLSVIEIKPLQSNPQPHEQDRFKKDLQKLIAFRQTGYASAFFLVFGSSVDRSETTPTI